mgnify:CR=1 FL=1|jgi:anti-sigma factor RsiW
MTGICPPDDALSALVDEALPSSARAELLTHCAGCPQCATRLDGLRRLHEAFLALPPAMLNVDLGKRVIARLQADAAPAVQARPHMGWRARWMSLARPLTHWSFALSSSAGATAAIVMGLWLGESLLQMEPPMSPPSKSVTLVAMSLFDSVPPGNLCPSAHACDPTGNSR